QVIPGAAGILLLRLIYRKQEVGKQGCDFGIQEGVLILLLESEEEEGEDQRGILLLEQGDGLVACEQPPDFVGMCKIDLHYLRIPGLGKPQPRKNFCQYLSIPGRKSAPRLVYSLVRRWTLGRFQGEVDMVGLVDYSDCKFFKGVMIAANSII